jgi:hypothetical protein
VKLPLSAYAGDSDLFQVNMNYLGGWQQFKPMPEGRK